MSFIKLLLIRILEITTQILPENTFGCRIRGLCYKPFLAQSGKNLQVGLAVKLEHLHNIKIGKDVYVGHGSWLSGLRGGLVLDDEVLIGPYVTMVSSEHQFENGSARFALDKGAPIKIGKGCWIASGVTITSGTTIGKSVLCASGAVVTKDIADNSIAAGVPAKIIGTTNKVE